jgi:phosphate-selective porin
MHKKILGLAVAAALVSGNAIAATSVEEKIEILQQEIEALKDQMATSEKSNKPGGIQSFVERTTIGGYGELHYNNFSGNTAPAPYSTTKKDIKPDEIDFHRFVLFFGHKFNDWISFKSELELEHSDTENNGAVELEQAYLDFNFNQNLNAKAGVFLIPLGMLNETHEPPTFYGVERNQIETRVIPTTWREAGAGFYGEALPGWNYEIYATSSLDAADYKSSFNNAVRDGRSNVSESPAENIAFSGKLDYTGVPGLLVGAAMFTGNTGQNGAGNPALKGVDARLTMWDTHMRYQKDRIDLRALYAHGHLGDADELKQAGINAAEDFYGWYAEAAYHVWKSGDNDLAAFVRYESWNTQEEVPSNVVASSANENDVWTVGANYWPHPQVVFKADYQEWDKPDADKGDKRMNLGLGYMF